MGALLVTTAALLGCAGHIVPFRHRIYYDEDDEASSHLARACVSECYSRASTSAEFFGCFDQCPNAVVTANASCIPGVEPRGTICLTSEERVLEGGEALAGAVGELVDAAVQDAAEGHESGGGSTSSVEPESSPASTMQAHPVRPRANGSQFPQSARRAAHPTGR